MFFWMKSVLSYHDYHDKPFKPELVPKSLLALGARLVWEELAVLAAEYYGDRSKAVYILAANKIDSPRDLSLSHEFHGLGLGEPIAMSAEHGEGVVDLFEHLRPHVEREEPLEAEEDAEEGPLKLAIVGRPNAGKSTLVNRMLGEERMITGPEAGITRDSITTDLDWKGRAVTLVDTAGLRKRAKVTDKWLWKLKVPKALLVAVSRAGRSVRPEISSNGSFNRRLGE